MKKILLLLALIFAGCTTEVIKEPDKKPTPTVEVGVVNEGFESFTVYWGSGFWAFHTPHGYGDTMYINMPETHSVIVVTDGDTGTIYSRIEVVADSVYTLVVK